MRQRLAVVLLLVAGLGAHAEPPPAEPAELPRIEVAGKGGRKVLPYLALQAGRSRFEDRRAALSPQGELRFELLSQTAGTRPLLSTASADTELPLDRQRRFELPMLVAAEAKDAELWFDRDPKASGWITPRVLSPGLGERERRLGDLHLECELNIAIAKFLASWWQLPLIASFERLASCNHDLPIGIQDAWISQGERRLGLRLEGPRKRNIVLPKLKDWPADSTIAWTVGPAEPAASAPPP